MGRLAGGGGLDFGLDVLDCVLDLVEKEGHGVVRRLRWGGGGRGRGRGDAHGVVGARKLLECLVGGGYWVGMN
jgi:hypothetical protein